MSEILRGPVLVIAPHPDDEVLGAGGTIARLSAEGQEVHIAIVTKGYPPEWSADFIEQGRREAAEAHRLLRTRTTHFLDFPAAALDTVPHRELNARLSTLLAKVRPQTVLVPFIGDIHADHQQSFLSTLVAARPSGAAPPRTILAYETLSETNWNAPYLSPAFTPNVFVDITEFLDVKIDAMRAYASQIKVFPHERSAEALRALAMLRGSTVGARAAEAFVVIRTII